ncbi:FecR family protein [Chitinophaga sp. 22321]|uniref:FecR domain-containing protein n=1 Tax=Chitinophaga hostae TaxID=2831022 RepID=A0ABS5J522_9BACT|nr:FecR family protein [Chitinophaga hostae]MBS0030319.1 FecR domain-containing protein [Chitinophaga hostae]
MQFKSDTISRNAAWQKTITLLMLGGMVFAGCQPKAPEHTSVNLQTPGIKYTSYKGTTGQRTPVTLPDSSRVILNSASELQVPENYGQGNRAVILDGDAFFSVTPATDTFTVTSDKLRATVLGTSFKMRSFASQHGATVYLLTGKIRVGKSYHSATDNQPEILERGQMILANNEIDLMEKETYHPEELETWLSDTLHITNANPMVLGRVLEEWFGVEIEMKGDASRAPVITDARFYHATLDEVLRNIGEQQHFKYKISDNKAVITF